MPVNFNAPPSLDSFSFAFISHVALPVRNASSSLGKYLERLKERENTYHLAHLGHLSSMCAPKCMDVRVAVWRYAKFGAKAIGAYLAQAPRSNCGTKLLTASN